VPPDPPKKKVAASFDEPITSVTAARSPSTTPSTSTSGAPALTTSSRSSPTAGASGLGTASWSYLDTASTRASRTDRYTKAIGQLGDEKLDVRLGGIYALERLAFDSKRDHRTVVEVLSAFVRERSAAAGAPRVRAVGRKTAHPLSLTARRVTQMPTDAQAALTVLGRLPERKDVTRGDLGKANLPGATLSRANLAGATLSRANLAGAYLYRADLAGAHLYRADLTGAHLDGADLTDAHLDGADLTDAHLDGADLTGATLVGADLTDAQGLTQDEIASARGNAATTLPDGVIRPASWT
jgi:hypothetical protein